MNQPELYPAVILSAGKSRRMGFPKLLLAENGEWLVKTMLMKLEKAGWNKLGIVLSDDYLIDIVASKLTEIEIIRNTTPETGMIGSIRLAIEWAGEDSVGLLTWPVDHPLVELATLRSIRSAAGPDRIVVPEFQGNRRGHPTWFGRTVWKRLLSSEADWGARAILNHREVSVLGLPVEDDKVLLNINTPEDVIKHRLDRFSFDER